MSLQVFSLRVAASSILQVTSTTGLIVKKRDQAALEINTKVGGHRTMKAVKLVKLKMSLTQRHLH